MNDTITRSESATAAERSPVLNEARLNLFRALRLPITAGADDAVWKSEEILTLLRAGLPPQDEDPLPWLPPPGEAEVRQAVQAAEEPLRRLLARLCWFDFDADPAGDQLRRAVATLEPADVDAFLNAATPESPQAKVEQPLSLEAPAPSQSVSTGLSRSGDAVLDADADFWASLNKLNLSTPTPAPPPPEPVAWMEDGPVAASNGVVAEPVPAKEPTSQAFTSAIRRVNRANLLLLLAARATVATARATPSASADPIPWKDSSGVKLAVNPHTADPAAGDRAAELARSSDLWSQALGQWGSLLRDQEFQGFLRACLIELNDEIVGPDDAESVVNSLWTRLADLVAGEVKAHLGEGRYDRAAALLKVAGASGIEARRWVMALRSLRPRFRADVAELDVLLPADSAARFDDIELYLDRVHALARRWHALDPAGMLALGEITDEAVAKAVSQLASCQDYSTSERVGGLLEKASAAAVADSVKSRAAAAVKQIDDLKEYACHFCQKRDLDVNSCAILHGKKETGRSTYGNTTTIYYSMKKGLIPRCKRCAELHEFVRWSAYWTWIALLPVALVIGYALLLAPKEDPYIAPVKPKTSTYSPYSYSSSEDEDSTPSYYTPSYSSSYSTPKKADTVLPLAVIGIIGGIYWVSGYLVRVIVAGVVTPSQERSYSDVVQSKQHKGLRSEGYGITLDYSRDAYRKVAKGG